MPPPSSGEIYDRAIQFKDDLIAQERKASARIIDAYGRSYRKMSDNIRVLTEKIERARGQNEYVSPSWAFQIDRYQALQRQITEEIGNIANDLNNTIITQQSLAFSTAIQDVSDLVNMSAQNAGVTVSFSRLATDASESIVGFLSDGSPLKSLLDKLPGLAGQSIANALTDAIIRGHNPTKTAAKIRAALGGNMNRALIISRTETMRAYREATHRTLQKNGDILVGWIWVASFSRRTCGSCLALAGSVHRLDERMESHPRCRCSQAPLIRGQQVEFEKGEDWFANQSLDTQRSILGSNAAVNAYRNGQVKLTDFVGRQNSPQWGKPYYQLSTRRAILRQGVFPGYNHPTDIAGIGALLQRSSIQSSSPEIIQPAIPAISPPVRQSAQLARKRIEEIGQKYKSEIDAAYNEMQQARSVFRKSGLYLSSPEYRTYYEKTLAYEKIDQRRLNEMRQVLYQDKSAQFQVTMSSKVKTSKTIAAGVEEFKKLIGPGLIDGQTVGTKLLRGVNSRASYLNGKINIRYNEDIHTIVHELGHWLEEKNQDIFNDVSAFFNRRTAGYPIEYLGRPYRRDERTIKDKFMHPYTGKIYRNSSGSRTASEILSMGLQFFYQMPLDFAKTDPDYFDFIYNVVRR